jgi:hypothetical protein
VERPMNGMKINIAVIFAVVIQAIGLVWYVSKIDSKVETMYSEFQANNKTEVIENQVRMKLDLENVIIDLKSLKDDVKKMQNKDQTIIKQNNKIERQHEKLFDLIDSNKNKKQQKGQEQQYSYD